jgi:hypothetical protein
MKDQLPNNEEKQIPESTQFELLELLQQNDDFHFLQISVFTFTLTRLQEKS